MTPIQKLALAQLDAQVAYAEKAIHDPALTPSDAAMVEWLNVLARVRRERSILVHSF